MTKYIFEVDAINIVPEAVAGAYRNRSCVIYAGSIEHALTQAEKRWKSNRQFRFEYRYIAKEQNSTPQPTDQSKQEQLDHEPS